jgi:hypothetical protein
MKAAPIRFLSAVLWPFTVWLSFSQFDRHGADDFVERTSPIVAFAVVFWLCAAGLAGLWYLIHPGSFVVVSVEGIEQSARLVRRWPQIMTNVLGLLTPAIYAIGFWMFTARAERFAD